EAMTLEQVRDLLRNGGPWVFTWVNGHGYTFDDIADAIDARLSRAAEPVVWQWRSPPGTRDVWHDCTRSEYEAAKANGYFTDATGFNWPCITRALYAHPPEPARDAALRALIKTWRIRSEKNYAQHKRTNTGFNVDWESYGRAEALSDCADELDAAMAQESGDAKEGE
ncbi:MAG TPA: hypothetical protein VFW60_09640, partial [Rhodanobacteraceae bacterium]|nr:hypothetical protein [Rhodanobacteraceae bacterium]